MPKTVNQIRERLQKPQNKNTIAEAIEHQERIKFHTIPSLTSSYASTQTQKFIKWAEEILSESQKIKLFKTVFKFPVDTNSICEDVSKALDKVYEGQNPIRDYRFKDGKNKDDFIQYIENDLGGVSKFRDSFNKVMNGNINSFVIVDMDTELNHDPKPYYYFLDIDKVLDYEYKDGKVTFLMYKNKEEKLLVYDDTSYRVFNYKDNNLSSEAEIENEHELGFCPVSFAWTDSFPNSSGDKKLSPFTNQLSKLDWLLFFSVSKKAADLYSPYTIYYGLQEDCDFETDELICNEGYLMAKREGDDRYLVKGATSLTPCPKCGNKINGVGSFIEVPVNRGEEDYKLNAPIGKIDVDVNSLNYNVAEIKRLEELFYKAMTGNSLESVTDQAINEKQVTSLFESRKQTLVHLKQNHENCEEFIMGTIAKLMYPGTFEGVTIDYGTEFYLFTAEVIFDMYSEAREKGLDAPTLDMLQEQAYQTKYKNNPNEYLKVKIMLNLDPFRHLTNEEVRGMKRAAEIEFTDYMLKVNLSSYIMRFERENGNIIEFGKNLNFDQRVKKIRERLISYIVEPQTQNIN